MKKLDKNTALIAIERYVEKFKGTEEARRLKKLENIIGDTGEIPMDQALNLLFNGTDKTAMDSLRKSRQTIKNNAESENLKFELVADNNKKSEPKDRLLWFEGTDFLESEAIEYFKESSTTTRTTTQNYAIGGKTTVSYFVSYAHDDAAKAKEFLGIFSNHASTSGKYNFKKWLDDDIIVGDDWEKQIEDAIKNCDFGLFLLSAKFFNSTFISEKELKKFIHKNEDGSIRYLKSFVPVALKSINPDGDLKGLEKVQIFYYNEKCFLEVAGDNKEKFAIVLVKKIEQKLETDFISKPKPELQTETKSENYSEEENVFNHIEFADLREIRNKPHDIRNPALAKDKPSQSENISSGSGEKTKALDLITDWLENGKNSIYALLGDFGMGKTFTSKMFCQQQINKFKNGETKYFPFYFDLRNLDLNEIEQSISIENVFNSILKKSHAIGSKANIDFNTVTSIREHHNTITIIDGIDEVLPHLETRRQNHSFLFCFVCP